MLLLCVYFYFGWEKAEIDGVKNQNVEVLYSDILYARITPIIFHNTFVVCRLTNAFVHYGVEIVIIIMFIIFIFIFQQTENEWKSSQCNPVNSSAKKNHKKENSLLKFLALVCIWYIFVDHKKSRLRFKFSKLWARW